MNRDYDVFEKLPDGAPRWRDCVHGLENVLNKLAILASSSRNEFFAIHTPTKEIVLRINTPNGVNFEKKVSRC